MQSRRVEGSVSDQLNGLFDLLLHNLVQQFAGFLMPLPLFGIGLTDLFLLPASLLHLDRLGQKSLYHFDDCRTDLVIGVQSFAFLPEDRQVVCEEASETSHAGLSKEVGR
jgi:hypothetical protein